MNMVFYLVLFMLVNGEPVTIKDPEVFHTYEECVSYGVPILAKSLEILEGEPESFADGICVKRDFTHIGNP